MPKNNLQNILGGKNTSGKLWKIKKPGNGSNNHGEA